MGKRKHLPLPTGPHTVGCVDFMTEGPDNVFARLFYPTDPCNIMERKSLWPLWVPRKEYAMGYAHVLRKGKFITERIFKALSKKVYIPAVWQAGLKRTSRPYPVIVFSHGLGGNRTCYSKLCIDLASRGYFVVMLEHRDGSASVTLKLNDPESSSLDSNNNPAAAADTPDSESLPRPQSTGSLSSSAGGSPFHRSATYTEEWYKLEHYKDVFDFTVRHRQMQKRKAEVSRALDLMHEFNRGRSVHNVLGCHFDIDRVEGALDLEKVAIIGHSFGGGTVVGVLADDYRFKCGIALDAWMMPVGQEHYPRVTQPLLFLNDWTFQVPQNVSDMTWFLSREHNSLLTVRGTCHQSQTDFQFVLGPFLSRLAGFRNKLDSHYALEIQEKAITGFFNKHCGLAGPQHDDILLAAHDQILHGTNKDIRGNDHSAQCPWKIVHPNHRCVRSLEPGPCKRLSYHDATRDEVDAARRDGDGATLKRMKFISASEETLLELDDDWSPVTFDVGVPS